LGSLKLDVKCGKIVNWGILSGGSTVVVK
jgi:hypothetical protein